MQVSPDSGYRYAGFELVQKLISNLGATGRIRRIKCDLSQPSCLKCLSTGRTCDGHGDVRLIVRADAGTSLGHNDKINTTIDGACDAIIPHSLGPFMIVPSAGSAPTEPMGFFECISIKHLDEYHACESWRNTLMLFSQTVPPVRHAAIALALLHRICLDRGSSNPLKSDKTPLLHYNRAIQLLLDQKTGDTNERTSITILVCYLFICFDQLARNYVQSMKHLRGGVELSRTVNRPLMNNNHDIDTTLIGHITRQIRRLDMQAVTFLVDWTPADIPPEDIPRLQLSPSNGTPFKFQSLPEAADQLQILVAGVMRLLNFGAPRPPPTHPSSQLTATLLTQLQTWSHLFETMMLELSSNAPSASNHHFPSLLRLHHTISHILLQVHSVPGPDNMKEMAYDAHLPDFQHCISLADTIAAASDTDRYPPKGPTFTPEVGIIPALYIIGVKCRHPVVRREVLGILRRRERREAVWDSGIAARVVERVIEIEEGGVSGRMVNEMGEIEMGQRVESVSWVHVVEEERVDVRYMFCGRKGEVVESILV